MGTQLDLFSTTAPAQYDDMPLAQPERTEAPVITGTVADQMKRTGTQCDAILARLREGSATNHELSEISLKYTGRISDLRKMGHDIECVKIERVSGLSVYRLKEGT
jgi:hypothetical protein